MYSGARFWEKSTRKVPVSSFVSIFVFSVALSVGCTKQVSTQRILDESGLRNPRTLAPDFTVTDIQGKAISLSRYRGKVVLLDFWAEWCGPCKMIAPILDEIADQYKDKIRIAKLNIDDNPATPPKFNIRGIPTLILFKNGTVEAQKVGAVTKSQLAAFLDSNL